MKPDDPRISNSARQVQPFLAMEIFERSQELERQGIDIVHLEVGEPDFSVPACVDPALIGKLINERSKGILINSPSNPTAAVQGHDTLEQIAALGVPVISDEIYHGLEYGGADARAVSMLEVTDDCFVVDGFSKRHAMTGLRVG